MDPDRDAPMDPGLEAVLGLEPVRSALAELRDRRAIERLFERDASLWSGDAAVQASIRDRLGWLDIAGGRPDWEGPLRRTTYAVGAEGLNRVVLAGMGGSSLAPEVFARLFSGHVKGADAHVLDSTHPAVVRRLLDDADMSTTLVIVSSKSGTTDETRAFAAHAERLVASSANLLAITDPGSPLEHHAEEHNFRDVFANPPDIGGRYSALSLFGMLPAALIGVDIDAVWARGRSMLERCGPSADADANPAAQLAAFMAGLVRVGRDKLTLLAPPELEPLGDWIEQLVAESTGKDGRGIVPVVREPPGDAAAYASDRAFVAYRLTGHVSPLVGSLANAGHPVFVCDVDDRIDVGAEFVRWQVATALAGALLGVNPFDEPNVAESKANTAKVLEEVAGGGSLPDPEDGDAVGLLRDVAPSDYLALQSYLEPTVEQARALAVLRTAVRDQRRVATTAGWGPRYLHSTGQLHKGGPDSVVALQLVDAALWAGDGDAPDIPGRGYGFATLARAQAIGDLRSLRDRGRRVVQATVSSPADVEQLAEALAR
jgi:transaldolase / glucose-6-phosphate isomerase